MFGGEKKEKKEKETVQLWKKIQIEKADFFLENKKKQTFIQQNRSLIYLFITCIFDVFS